MSTPQRFVPDPRVEAAIEYGLSLHLDAPWETNGQGQIIVNPPIGLPHAKRAGKLISVLKDLCPDWQIWPELGIHTTDGVKAPDLSAAAPGFAESADCRGFLLGAPDLCVEIMSPSNTWDEMRHKTRLYLAAGAREVWICDEAGVLHFFDHSGEKSASTLAAGMTKALG